MKARSSQNAMRTRGRHTQPCKKCKKNVKKCNEMTIKSMVLYTSKKHKTIWTPRQNTRPHIKISWEILTQTDQAP